MKKIILNLIFVLVIGGIGGILMDRFLFPTLSQYSPFNKIGWIRDQKNITQIINKTEQVIIKENEALEEAIQKVSPTVGIVLQKDKKGNILNQLPGFILTSDGLILTSADIAQKPFGLYFLTRENKEFAVELSKENLKLNLAILKAPASNFPTVPLGEFERIRLGEMVFLVGAKMEEVLPGKNNLAWQANFQNFTNGGLIKEVNQEEIVLNFSEQKFASGSPLFNIKGEMIGVNLVDNKGETRVVPINKIKEFIK